MIKFKMGEDREWSIREDAVLGICQKPSGDAKAPYGLVITLAGGADMIFKFKDKHTRNNLAQNVVDNLTAWMDRGKPVVTPGAKEKGDSMDLRMRMDGVDDGVKDELKKFHKRIDELEHLVGEKETTIGELRELINSSKKNEDKDTPQKFVHGKQEGQELPIEELNIPQRPYNSLRRHGIVNKGKKKDESLTIGELLKIPMKEFVSINNFGAYSLALVGRFTPRATCLTTLRLTPWIRIT